MKIPENQEAMNFSCILLGKLIKRPENGIQALGRAGILLLLCLTAGCGEKKKAGFQGSSSLQEVAPPLEVKRAQNFEVKFYENVKLVTVKNPWKGVDKSFTYLLTENDQDMPPAFEADAVIKIPVQSMVCLSTSHVSLLEYLDESDKLTGFPNIRFISSPKARARVEQGKVTDLGSELDVNTELLLTLDPDVVMAFGGGQFNNRFHILENAGTPVIWNADYMEKDPLGRAEWIKFASLFFNKEKMADSVFSAIEQRYDSLRNLVADTRSRPSVFSGILYGDGWFMPGGGNYASTFFTDAGANYLWSDSPEDGYITVAFENVYEKALQSDFWIGVGSFEKLEQLKQADSRYSSFKAFRNGKVFNYMGKIGPGGGNEYFETGYLRPDLILEDLIRIFHPEKLPDHELYFYNHLK